MGKPRTFDADARTAERSQEQITIGGQTWRPRPRTGKVAREISKLGKAPETPGGGDPPPEMLPEIMDYMYRSLAVMLENTDGEQPDAEWLSDNLEWSIANDLMEFLNPEPASPPTPVQPVAAISTKS